MKVLLLGGGLQGLSFGESLSHLQNYYVAAVYNSIDIRHSRFFDKVYQTKGRAYETILDCIFLDVHFDVIVPMGDKAASFLSKNKQEIEDKFHVRCAVPEYKCLSIVEDKSSFMAFCRENNIPHPLTVSLTMDNLSTASNKVGFPALIKPDFSVGARGITRVDSMDELIRQYPTIREKFGSCSLQEYIDNPDYYYNVMLYRDSLGYCDNSVVIKIVRMYPVKGGSSCCCISVENPALVDICKKVLEKLNWTGMADFDVLQRKDTMEYKIIEINPRVPASLRAAYISGVNFPEIIVRDVSGKSQMQYHYKSGRILRYMGIDLLWFLKSSHRSSSSPSWFYFWGKNVYYQDIYLFDPSTWYSWLVVGLKKYLTH